MSWSAELEHVSKSYGQILALDDATLKVGKNEIFTLIGPNGSGKTTLLRILACIETPDNGNVYLHGRKIDDKNRDKAKLNTTLVFQRTSLFATSVYNNIAYGLRLRNLSKNHVYSAVKRALRTVRLEGFENRLAKKLSGGEQQRVSLARALALDTSLLLLDEPTANLDPKSASLIEEIIKEVNQEKQRTIIMATHNLFQAKHIGESAALLVNGRIIKIGTIREMLTGESGELAELARIENIFSGTLELLEGGTSRLSLENGILIETALDREGRFSVFISPEDIIISKRRLESSARNVFKGTIEEILDYGSLVKLKVNTGRDFIVQITKRSFIEMGLNVGSLVYLTFKASSVKII
ncbi:MAG: ABC transporter ATP-binding protein [Candidatus Bathyarchaeota archaeon]|nr:MAG: ABC transporter ATP-binding protein [Candidatus Bathyarchaeota archaeon]